MQASQGVAEHVARQDMIHEAELEKDGKVAGDGHRDLSTKDEDGQEKETAAGPSGDSKAVYGAAEVLADVDTVLLEKKLVRKLDIRILPVIVLLYVLNYLDRNNIAAGRDSGLQSDLRMTDRQYETCLSILYVGYILLQAPSNLLLAYIGRPRFYLSTCVIVWGVVSTLSSVADNFIHMLVIRLFLGVVEAAFFPGALLLLSKWYKRSELSSRMALLYSGSILSNAVSGLISAGILGNMNGLRGLAGWRWLFIVEGAATIFIGLLSMLVLVDFPHNSSMLTQQERVLAVQRITEDQGQTDVEGANGDMPSDGLKQALTDPLIWLFMMCLTSCVCGCAFNQFFPTIVGTLGYDHITTLIITFGPWGWSFLCVLLNALHANKTGERTLHLIIPLCIGIIGFIIASVTENLGARFFALFLEAQSYAGYVIILSWLSNSIRGSYKRAAGLALVNCVSQLGNVAGSYVWPTRWGPLYWQSNLISTCCFLATIACAVGIRMVLLHRNRALDRMHGTVAQQLGGGQQSTPSEARIGHNHHTNGHGNGNGNVAGEGAVRRSLEARLNFRYLV